jgi:hypothetical protein
MKCPQLRIEGLDELARFRIDDHHLAELRDAVIARDDW